MSSIVCHTEAAEAVGELPVKVIIDSLQVNDTKMFSYKNNPVINSVFPNCSFQRYDTKLVKLIGLPPSSSSKLAGMLIYIALQRLQAGDRRSES